jgi:hypothetical protein
MRSLATGALGAMDATQTMVALDLARRLRFERDRACDCRLQEENRRSWITQDSLSHDGQMLILKETVEGAGSIDAETVNAALRAMDLRAGPARFFAGGRVPFDATGKREGARIVIVRWRRGEPVTTYPPEAALTEPIWPKQ